MVPTFLPRWYWNIFMRKIISRRKMKQVAGRFTVQTPVSRRRFVYLWHHILKEWTLLVEQILSRWHQESGVSPVVGCMICYLWAEWYVQETELNVHMMFAAFMGNTLRRPVGWGGRGGEISLCVIRKALIIRSVLILHSLTLPCCRTDRTAHVIVLQPYGTHVQRKRVEDL